ncbi:MAG: hypothetical protein WBO37_11095 [Gammaproteobacteria bacterium]
MNNEEEYEFAFCWLDEEQWKLLAELDPDGVDDSYEAWRKNASRALSGIQASGKKVRKVSIKISRLQEWCNKKGLEPNSKARAEYVSMLAHSENGDKCI